MAEPLTTDADPEWIRRHDAEAMEMEDRILAGRSETDQICLRPEMRKLREYSINELRKHAKAS